MTTTAEEYRRLRRKYPYNPASQTILWARGNVKDPELDWKTFVGRHVAVATTVRDGFDIRVTVDYDENADPMVEETDTDTGIRNPRFRWTGDAWDVRHIERYLSVESGTTVRELAPYYHDGGDSKNVAWERARQSLQREAEAYMADDYAEYVIKATASLDGIELGSGAIGGCDVDSDARFEKELDNLVSETGVIEEAIAEARDNAKKLDARLHQTGLLTTA